MNHSTGTVSDLWRYPIKSIGGEQIRCAEIETRGIVGDRLWAVKDAQGKFGSGKSTRRFRQMDGLLEFSSYYHKVEDAPILVFPDGSEHLATSAEAITALQMRTGKRPLSVTAEQEISHFDEGPIHLLTSSALHLLREVYGETVDTRRFRNNITLETGSSAENLEADWLGQRLAIGETLILEIAYLMPRCVMVNVAQQDIPEKSDLLRTIAKINPDVCFGAFARVVQPGKISLGDAAHLMHS